MCFFIVEYLRKMCYSIFNYKTGSESNETERHFRVNQMESRR